MTVKTNAQGSKRKELVKTISAWLGEESTYSGAPTFAYNIGWATVDKNAEITITTAVDDEVIERLIQHLYDEGFDPDYCHPPIDVEDQSYATPSEAEEPTTICISMLASEFTDTALKNLEALVEAKGNLIKKALGTDSIPILKEDGKICFPWLKGEPTPAEVRAFDLFICKLCNMAKFQNRITAKEKEFDNEKYAFRCFLLRLGFIGDEFKQERKILLRNLSGSSAFKSGNPKEVTE